jgi:hypothetical protein
MKKNSSFHIKGIIKILKVIFRCTVILLVMIMVEVLLPNVPIATLLTEQLKEVKSTVEQETSDAEQVEVVDQTTAKSDSQIETISQSEEGETAVTEEDAKPETQGEESMEGKGIDLRNDPDYIAELKTIYNEEDLNRLYAPRQWVSMPNVVGISEAQALSTLRAKGLVGRVVYEDRGKEEGTVFMQEFPAGIEWNTDASFFIWVQRADKTTVAAPVKEVVETTPKQTKPIENPKPKPVEPVKPNPVEPVENTETKPTVPVENTEPAETAEGTSPTVEPSDTSAGQGN